jgi:hypothetical protein
MMQYLLCENKWDEMTYMHCFRRWAPACVQIKWFLIFIGIENLIHIPNGKKRKGNNVIFCKTYQSTKAHLEMKNKDRNKTTQIITRVCYL